MTSNIIDISREAVLRVILPRSDDEFVVRERADFYAARLASSRPVLGIEETGVGEMASVPFFVPPRLCAGVVALCAQKLLMGVGHVAMEWEEGADFVDVLVLEDMLLLESLEKGCGYWKLLVGPSGCVHEAFLGIQV